MISPEDNPFSLFDEWFFEAKSKSVAYDATAFCLATVSGGGVPSNRIVLLRGIKDEKFTFYTNYASEKSDDLTDNPNASMCFYWAEIDKQVRINGVASRCSTAMSDEYFASRTREKQISAIASKQSSMLSSVEEFEENISAIEEKYQGQKIPRPDFWGGWSLEPLEMEFWQTGEHRRHDRLKYSRDEVSGEWRHVMLYP